MPACVCQVRPIMWVLALLLPVTSVVQVGGGILQGATDFNYQVRSWVVVDCCRSVVDRNRTSNIH